MSEPGAAESAGAESKASRSGPLSECEPYREIILSKLDAGLSASRSIICRMLVPAIEPLICMLANARPPWPSAPETDRMRSPGE